MSIKKVHNPKKLNKNVGDFKEWSNGRVHEGEGKYVEH